MGSAPLSFKMPISLAVLLSIALHAIWLLFLGIDNPGRQTAHAALQGNISGFDVSLVRETVATLDQRKLPEAHAIGASPAATESLPTQKAAALDKSAAVNLPVDVPDEIYMPASEIQRPAELLIPYDVDLIPGASGISGRLRLELKVDRYGKVREVRVIDSLDPGKRMENVVIPWLKSNAFQPGSKNGVAVNSLLQIDLTLVPPDPVDPNYRATRSPGQPLWMDDKGKFINDAPPVRTP